MPNADHRVALPIEERQYHISLGPGELAEYILLPGDPERTDRIATRLDSIELERRNREFVTVTGTYRGERVSVVSTGIGTDNVEIVVAEILAITERPTFIRVGSCGTLQPEIGLGDLIISSGAVRLEATTSFFVHDGYPAIADYEAIVALVEAAARLGHRAHVGVTATAPGFYGAQGRPIPQLPIRYPDLAEEMARQRVLNFEMEASALLVLAHLAGMSSGGRLRGVRAADHGRLRDRRSQGPRRGGLRRDRTRGTPDPRRDGASEARSPDGPLAAVTLEWNVSKRMRGVRPVTPR